MKKFKKGWILRQLRVLLEFLLNPRFLLCFGVAWMITNGWSYVFAAVGGWLRIPWMVAVGGAYLAFLWLPATPEKVVTVAIAMLLLQWLFPKDEKTLGVLRKLHPKFKLKHLQRKKKRKRLEPTEDSTPLPPTD
jgi:hypothetical protein